MSTLMNGVTKQRLQPYVDEMQHKERKKLKKSAQLLKSNRQSSLVPIVVRNDQLMSASASDLNENMQTETISLNRNLKSGGSTRCKKNIFVNNSQTQLGMKSRQNDIAPSISEDVYLTNASSVRPNTTMDGQLRKGSRSSKRHLDSSAESVSFGGQELKSQDTQSILAQKCAVINEGNEDIIVDFSVQNKSLKALVDQDYQTAIHDRRPETHNCQYRSSLNRRSQSNSQLSRQSSAGSYVNGLKKHTDRMKAANLKNQLSAKIQYDYSSDALEKVDKPQFFRKRGPKSIAPEMYQSAKVGESCTSVVVKGQMDKKSITNCLREPALKSLQQKRSLNKLRYSHAESNEAYKLNVSHLQKIRQFLGNNGKVASHPLHAVADIPGLFPVRNEPRELPVWPHQNSPNKKPELSFSKNDNFNKILNQRAMGIDFRTLSDAHQDSDGADIESHRQSKRSKTGSPMKHQFQSSPKKRVKGHDCKITRDMMLDPCVTDAFNTKMNPVAQNIQKQLFAKAQHSENKLTSIDMTEGGGKTYLFNDKRAGVVIADNGLPYGSKYRHLIIEHDRLRRVKYVQDRMLQKEEERRKKGMYNDIPMRVMKSQKPTKWIATASGYKEQEDDFEYGNYHEKCKDKRQTDPL